MKTLLAARAAAADLISSRLKVVTLKEQTLTPALSHPMGEGESLAARLYMPALRRPGSIGAFFKNFKPLSIAAEEVDDNSFLKVGFFHRVMKLLGIGHGLLVNGGDDVAALDADVISEGILFDVDYDDSLNQVNAVLIGQFIGPRVDG